MGGFAATVGKYYVYYGDYAWDYVKDRKTKEYYEEYEIDATLEIDDEKIDIKIPLLDLVNLKKYRTKYGFEWSDDKTLHKWLYNYVISKVMILNVMYV